MHASRVGTLRARSVAVPVALRTLVALLALLVGLAGPGARPAGATSPTGSTPKDGSTITAPPPFVAVDFSEPVIPAFGQGLEVFDAAGTKVDTGPLYSSELTRVAAKMPATLPPGAYTARYQVQSPNGPILKGQITFTLADPNAVDTSSGTNWWRIASWGALAVTALLLLFQVFLLVLADPEDRQRLQREAAVAAAITLGATVVLAVLAATVG